MSACAVMLVRDEADIIRWTLAHLITQVDYIIISDNRSSDGTNSILHDIAALDAKSRIQVIDDPEVGYWQSRKTTDLAMHALARGFDWVIPCDADEFWYAPDGRRLSAWLDGLTPDVQIVGADLYDHVPTALDDAEVANPFARIGWRKREHGALGKVACRLRPDLVIQPGNHGATTTGTALRTGGLVIRHYSWRSEEQYLRKIRNGAEAYAATDLNEAIGAHWRMWNEATDDAVREHFRRWFHAADPHADSSLMYDPAPGMPR